MARGATSILELRRIIALLAGLSLFLGFAGVVGAEDRATLDEPFEITADRIDYDGVRQRYVATGHVRIAQTARSLIALFSTPLSALWSGLRRSSRAAFFSLRSSSCTSSPSWAGGAWAWTGTAMPA